LAFADLISMHFVKYVGSGSWR